ncbi:MAG: DUF523 and DUF1722 domain-containing protein [Deltaproteobacteria bacterium]|nr:DUF523 and DUF1722 domain-containing protein [Deltaproteobacteria bacterium]MBW2138198.1 DUF523 and DUF1722 domain-containing protein [Deltaproteobacteria bacterium]
MEVSPQKGNLVEKIRIGISACLLGEQVRYDGGHARDRYITDTLGQYFEFVPVCPETEAGFGIPREPMRLVGDPGSPHLVTIKTGKDMTRRLIAWARKRVKDLESEGLCGIIFKSKSPSCGIERVKVYRDDGMPVKKGVGLFARSFMQHFPFVPAEEEGRLHDPHLRENFVERVFALKRWRSVLARGKSIGNLVDFHTHHKYLILSHSPQYYRQMGKLVAEAKSLKPRELYALYGELLMKALSHRATTRKHTNVLQHMMGYFKKVLSPDQKQELLEVIGAYHQGLVPLIVPVTLINHYVRKYDQGYLREQVYLHPHPLELKLRNHA